MLSRVSNRGPWRAVGRVGGPYPPVAPHDALGPLAGFLLLRSLFFLSLLLLIVRRRAIGIGVLRRIVFGLSGIRLPIGIFALMLAPYIDRNPSNKPEDRKLAVVLMTLFLMFWAVLVIIGSFFRGPGFNFVFPWIDGLFFEL